MTDGFDVWYFSSGAVGRDARPIGRIPGAAHTLTEEVRADNAEFPCFNALLFYTTNPYPFPTFSYPYYCCGGWINNPFVPPCLSCNRLLETERAR